MKSPNKRGVSILIAYVLLIVIAITISVLVYGFIKLYVPKEKPECAKDVSLTIQNPSCIVDTTSADLEFTMLNKGLFKAEAVYIRFGEEGKKIKQQVNNINDDNTPEKNKLSFYFNRQCPGENCGLAPGETYTAELEVTSEYESGTSDYEIEIEPAIYSEDELAPCSQYTTIQKVVCN